VGARPPAATRTPEGKQGPLYVNTTSSGPRGHWHPSKGVSYTADPGYAHLELSADGAIQRVEFRPGHGFGAQAPSSPPMPSQSATTEFEIARGDSTELVELADQIVGASLTRSAPVVVLHEMLSRTENAEALADSESGLFPDAAAIFDSFVYH